MRVTHWLAALLMILVIVAPTSIRAQSNNLELIDGGQEDQPKELPRILSGEEIARIKQLQGAVLWRMVSPVSPDDSRVLVVNSAQEFGVLNIRDGTSLALPVEAFGQELPLVLISPFSEGFQWVDEHTVASLAINLAAEQIQDVFSVIAIDLESGEVDSAPLGLDENTFPVSLAPGGRRVLLIETELPPQEGGMIRLSTHISAPGITAQTPRATPAQVAVALRKAPQLAPFLPETSGFAVYRAMQAATTTLHLKLLDLGGAPRELAAFPAGTVPGIASWRPDGAELALTIFGEFDPGQTRSAGRALLDGALISDQIYRDATGNLPPEINPMLQGSELRVFDLDAGTSRSARAADSGKAIFFAPTWSPDNSTLLVQMWHPAKLSDRSYPVYLWPERSSYRFYSRDLRDLGGFEAPQINGPYYSGAVFAAPDEVIFYSLVGTELHPYYYNRVSGEFRDIADRAGTYEQLVTTRQSRQLIYMHSAFTSPPDLYRMGWDGTAIARLTWANEELRLSSTTREYPVSFTLRNGQRRAGRLILPADVSYPPKDTRILLWQEGGPGGAMNNTWMANVENPYALLPNFGFGLLVVPLSGREGYGPAVLNALPDLANFGQIDIDEGAEISRQLISRGWSSSPKLGILGCSYGGYFTWQSITRYPDLYAAANPQCALIDLAIDWARGYASAMPLLQGRPPWAAPSEYIRDSPSYHGGQVRAAVLSFHGTEDFLPVTLNENLHLQLVNRGVPARMLKFAGAGHGLQRDDYQLYAAQEQIRWFREHLR